MYMAIPGTRKLLALFQIAAFAVGVVGYTPPSGARASTTAPVETNPTMARRVHIKGVRNFAEVTPTLYRGGQATPDGLRNLAKMGVSIVVDLRLTGREHERDEVTKLGMRYVEIPWQCFNPKDPDVARFLDVLRQNPGKKIFVHCFTGDDRTGMEIAAYRMAQQGWTAQQARKEMEAFGFNSFHRRICPGLGAYETHFPDRLAADPAFRNLRAQIAPPDPAPQR